MGWSLCWALVAVVVDVAVIVPRLAVAVVDLHDAHAALRQPAGQQAGVGELAVAVRARASPVGLAAAGRNFLGLELHAEGHLQRLDARLERLVAGRAAPGACSFMLLEQVELLALRGRRQVAVVDVRG